MAWSGFQTGLWQKEINVRDFIQQNYTPYDGDADFLAATLSGRGGSRREERRHDDPKKHFDRESYASV